MFVEESGLRVLVCEGYEECYPRFRINEEGEMYFTCRDIEACVNEEYAEKYPCTTTKGAIFYQLRNFQGFFVFFNFMQRVLGSEFPYKIVFL